MTTDQAFPQRPRREEAFRPFHRLDEGRAILQSGGAGLGLGDRARHRAGVHGGEVVLEQSALGGLSAIIRLPL